MKYKVRVPENLDKVLRKIPKDDWEKIDEKIKSLSKDPRPHGYIKLKGYKDLYRIRVGDYRVIYSIEDEIFLVIIVKIGDRKEIYHR